MSDQNPVIFIGSGEASLIERKVLIYSLKKNSSRNLDIRIFNGTHNSVESQSGASILTQLPLEIKRQNITEFSNYRFLIPELCEHQGKAIWLDSDMLCLGDIGELFSIPMLGNNFLCKSDAYKGSEKNQWGLSVSLYDCANTKFDLKKYYEEINDGLYHYHDLHQMTGKFLSLHQFNIGSLDPNWNVFDRHDPDTKLIHYTNLRTQPWKYRSHPYGNIWFKYFFEALQEGYLTKDDIDLTLVRAYARGDILSGNRWTFLQYLNQIYRDVKQELKCTLKRL